MPVLYGLNDELPADLADESEDEVPANQVEDPEEDE